MVIKGLCNIDARNPQKKEKKNIMEEGKKEKKEKIKSGAGGG